MSRERPGANPHVSWAIALGKPPSMSTTRLHDATVALRTEAAGLRDATTALRIEVERLRAETLALRSETAALRIELTTRDDEVGRLREELDEVGEALLGADL